MRLRYWITFTVLFVMFTFMHFSGTIQWSTFGSIGLYSLLSIFTFAFYMGFREAVVSIVGRNTEGVLAKSIMSNPAFFDIISRTLEIQVGLFWVYAVMFQVLPLPIDSVFILFLAIFLVTGMPGTQESRGSRRSMRYMLCLYLRQSQNNERVWVRIRYEIVGIGIGIVSSSYIIISLFIMPNPFGAIIGASILGSLFVAFRALEPAVRIGNRWYKERSQRNGYSTATS